MVATNVGHDCPFHPPARVLSLTSPLAVCQGGRHLHRSEARAGRPPRGGLHHQQQGRQRRGGYGSGWEQPLQEIRPYARVVKEEVIVLTFGASGKGPGVKYGLLSKRPAWPKIPLLEC